MRKNNNARTRRPRKSRNKSYVPSVPRMDIDNKDHHNDEVLLQLEACNAFIDQVNNTLEAFGSRIDNEGIETLGRNAQECITILESINDDLHQFSNELTPIVKQAKDFMNDDEGEAWLWTMNTHSLCESLNMLRDRYMALYMANYNSLLLQLNA